MPTFTNNRTDAVQFTALGINAEPGETFEVTDEQAEGLRIQGFPEQNPVNEPDTTDQPADQPAVDSQDGAI